MTTDVRAILDRDPFDASAVADLREVLGRDPSRYRTLREATQNIVDRELDKPKANTHLRLGIADCLLGRYRDAMSSLEKAGDVGMAHYFRGIALQNLQRWDDASDAFNAAAKGGYEPKRSELHRVGSLRRAGKIDEAARQLDKLEATAGGTAEFHYQRGSMLAAGGDLAAAAVELEKALELERDHTGALFELAYINDLFGEDAEAIRYYTQCIRRPPAPLAAYLNLGILYEDSMRFREAEDCYRQVLNYDPNHPRARLFFKDVRASKDMYYDEDTEKFNDRLIKILDISVNDFELSVRSRNCLRKLNIRTLGDLIRITEQALLASKNFGETSLSEIKEIMTSKGLRLGMALEGGGRPHAAPPNLPVMEEVSPEERALLAKPIGDLNLSVRARKCMTKLNVNTLGELISYTGDQLLECKNFGVTSLNEVRERLTQLGMKLKGE